MEKSRLLSVLALIVAATILDQVVADAPPCNGTIACDDPTVCRCSSTDIPGGLEIETVPQFVLLSFDDGVTVTNYPYYEDLSKFANPNGCGIKMTFFVSHENTDYNLVNQLHQKGHEIATHSVSHKPDIEDYWRNMTKEMWTQEIVDMRTMLTLYGNIPEEEIQGFRVPFLEVGGDLMYETLLENGFKYDCSWPTLKYTTWYVESEDDESLGVLWPYTLDTMSIQEQTVGTKPTNAFNGLWVNPMTDMQDNRGIECPMLDLCQSEEDELETSADAVTDMLTRNFKSHYYGDRSPFGLYTHHSWFVYDDNSNTTARHDGFSQFLEYLSGFPDVFVINVDSLIEWVKNPVTLEDLDSFEPLLCNNLPEDNCPEENVVKCAYKAPLPIEQSEVYMSICQGPCPPQYPWLSNPEGANDTTSYLS